MAKKTLEQFIKEAKEIHGDKYDYSKVEYINTNTKVCIICKEHGEFWQTPKAHLNGQGCPQCYGTKKRTNYKFAEDARKIHGDLYDYSQINYINNHTKIKIICPKHGEFWQRPTDHLHGFGCPECSGNKKMNSEMFVAKAKQIHSINYDYSKVLYKNNKTKVCIICPKHGEFLIRPDNFLNLHQGCPLCRISQGEKFIADTLNERGVSFVPQQTFDTLRGAGNGLLRFDFWLPNEKIAIEFNGRQHYTNDDFFWWG